MARSGLVLIQTPGNTPDIVVDTICDPPMIQVGQWAMSIEEASALGDNLDTAIATAIDAQ